MMDYAYSKYETFCICEIKMCFQTYCIFKCYTHSDSENESLQYIKEMAFHTDSIFIHQSNHAYCDFETLCNF